MTFCYFVEFFFLCAQECELLVLVISSHKLNLIHEQNDAQNVYSKLQPFTILYMSSSLEVLWLETNMMQN
jgi:hypothetical protein